MGKSELPEEITALIQAAEDGDATAQMYLGRMYQFGQGVPQNEHEAVGWYHKAAIQGDAQAKNQLGTMYQHGRGIEQNDHEAVSWYRESAEQGDAQAQSNLGYMYQHGRGVEKSYLEAVSWYRKAAEQHNTSAQYNLGMMYQHGRGVEQSYLEAVNWYHKAAEQGHSNAQNSLGWMYQNGLGVEQNDSLAIAWYLKSANQHNSKAQGNLGWMYLHGRGVPQSNSEAAAWYRKAAEQGEASAQYNLGWMYQNGIGVNKNNHKAANWYYKAANQGLAEAQFNLGLMYINGDGVEKDYAKAKDLFSKAADTTDPELRINAIEYQDQAERSFSSLRITEIRKRILNKLRVYPEKIPTMTHYTSLVVGNELLLKESPLRLGHINAFNDPNEGKLLWHYLGYPPMEGKPVFVGCFLLDDDSLNMWRFYSKNHHNDDACGCAITFSSDTFFDFDLLKKPQINLTKNDNNIVLSNSGASHQESRSFYKIIYVRNDMDIQNDDKNGSIRNDLSALKNEVEKFIGNEPDNEKLQKLSKLLGPLPYLLKDADYEAEQEHRIIITHLVYGAKEIQSQEPDLVNGTAPRLYLELHRKQHLAPVKHVTLGPKAPHREMMIPYWHHKLESAFANQLETKIDFCIRASKCAYK